MSNILITGSNGFIGSNILKNTHLDNKIILILRNKDRKNIGYYKNVKKIYYNDYDQLDKKLKKIKAEIIIHCATHYTKKHEAKDISKFVNSNILFGNILLNNLNNMRVKKFINFSSVWEDYNATKDNNVNLYSAYKKAFALLLSYYKQTTPKTFFYEIMLSETFGLNDKRKKLISVLKSNYKKNKITKINSSNLFINLLNTPYKISDIVNLFNKKNIKKIKVKWLSKKMITEKIFKYKVLKGWKPQQSKIEDIFHIIKGWYKYEDY